MREISIGKNDAGQRLDKFLIKTLYSLPAALMYKYIRLKKIKVNGARAEANQMLAEGDVVKFHIAEEFFELSSKDTETIPLAAVVPNIKIIYEDSNILLVDKPAGVLVHEDDDGEGNTLLLHIQSYLYHRGEYDPGRENSFAPALCNRIDRNTGGIVIAAKNAAALRFMNEKIKERQITKKYICAVHGTPPKREDTLTDYLVKDSSKNQVSVYREGKQPRGAKKIITKYRLLEKFANHISLLEIELVTGRTHQIRAHMASIGCPLVGDGKYGINKDDRAGGYKHQLLYSYYLRFDFDLVYPEFSYLCGREFVISAEDIWFVRELRGKSDEL